MKTKLFIFLVLWLSILPAQALADDPVVSKTFCTYAIGYDDLDKLKIDLVTSAKRDAVGELFGEFISASTAVENLVLTSDQIRTSSVGFVRVKGDIDYHNGENLAEVCVTINAFATEQDREKFEPVKITKKHCVTNETLTARQLKDYAQEEVIVQALLDYDRKLEQINRTDLLRLMQRITYLDSGFIENTETFCMEIEGYIVPIEVIALLEAVGITTDSSETALPPRNDNESVPPSSVTPAASISEEKTVGFASETDPSVLSEDWIWYVGSSSASSYDLTMDPGALVLITGPKTTQWKTDDTAPTVIYPASGDFEAQVKVSFNPTKNYQFANLGVRSSEDDTTWLRIGRAYGGGQGIMIQGAEQGRDLPTYGASYINSDTYLRVKRVGHLLSFFYSTNGVNWVTLQQNLTLDLPDMVEVYLSVYSTPNEGAVARFYDFKYKALLASDMAVKQSSASGQIPFVEKNTPDALSPVWGWQVGGVQSNAYNLDVETDTLTLTTGPKTDQWKSFDNSPSVTHPATGNFEAQVKVNFSPSKNYQYAILGVRSTEDSASWLRIGRAHDTRVSGGHGVFVQGSNRGGELRLNKASYTGSEVFLRVKRVGSLFSFFYSSDGINWNELQSDYVFDMPENVQVYLSVYSTANESISANFSEFNLY